MGDIHPLRHHVAVEGHTDVDEDLAHDVLMFLFTYSTRRESLLGALDGVVTVDSVIS
jgi:hypothetical protein